MTNTDEEKRRLFFGGEATAPWQQALPRGRLIDEASRHLTLAFLGNIPFADLQKILPSFPTPSFRVAPVGIIDKLLFLPEETPRVVSGHVHWLTKKEALDEFYHNLTHWLRGNRYPVSERAFLPHISVARGPFNPDEWKTIFQPLPVIIPALHLYESVGNLTYKPLWTQNLLPPFTEIEHTADIAFHIQGESLIELYFHAAVALAFKCPDLCRFIREDLAFGNLDDVIIALNDLVAIADAEIGVPFKAVSFHGEAKRDHRNLLQWEMIVDV